MNKTTAELLMDVARERNWEVDLQETYSGRGMFGATTFGIVCNSQAVLPLVALAAKRITVTRFIEDDKKWKEVEMNFHGDMENMRRDNMGMSVIIY